MVGSGQRVICGGSIWDTGGRGLRPMQSEEPAAARKVKLMPKGHKPCSRREHGGILTDYPSILVLICDGLAGRIAGHHHGVDEHARRIFSFKMGISPAISIWEFEKKGIGHVQLSSPIFWRRAKKLGCWEASGTKGAGVGASWRSWSRGISRVGS